MSSHARVSPQENQTVGVLIAEDDPFVSEQIRSQVTNLGHTIVGTAYDGPEAVELAHRLQPDVILMDLKMVDPVTDRDDPEAGLRAIQEILDHRPTPVILLTAYETPELIHRASEAGVGAYLVKPVQESELARAIAVARARFEDLATLRRLNQELLQANRELNAFAHTVAHDLKNPLSLLTGYAEMLCHDFELLTEKERLKSCTTIVRTAHKMGNIITELLLLAQVRQAEVETKPLDMSSIVFQAHQRLSEMIEEAGATLIVPDEWPSALGHAPWVEEVWVNYMSNAIKYGGQPPRLELGFDTTDRPPSIRFWVRDNGSGIAQEDQALLFVPFTRLDRARAQGHGLGLSIVQRIVTKLGGEVNLESKVGQGSLFSFSLPAAEKQQT